jgi:hypothetical protein
MLKTMLKKEIQEKISFARDYNKIIIGIPDENIINYYNVMVRQINTIIISKSIIKIFNIPVGTAAGSNCADCNRSASSVDVFWRQVIIASLYTKNRIPRPLQKRHHPFGGHRQTPVLIAVGDAAGD